MAQGNGQSCDVTMRLCQNKHLATQDITTAQAQAGLLAALRKTEQLHARMGIAVVDASANLIAFLRMDGAWLGSIDIAIKKAQQRSSSTWIRVTAAGSPSWVDRSITSNTPMVDSSRFLVECC